MANALKSGKSKKGAGRGKDEGPIVVDLGEEIDKKLRSVVGQVTMAGSKTGEKGKAEMGRGDGNYRPGMFGGYKPGGYRPGMFGGYRPWYADRDSSMGARQSIAQMVDKPWWVAGGLAIGVLANRALMRVSPDIVKTDIEVVHTGIIFGIGVIPLLIKPNAITLGVAIPGAVYFAGSLVDWMMNRAGIKKPALSGDAPAQAPRQGMDQALAAREKMAQMQQRILQQPAAQYQQQASGGRVSARAV